MSEKIVPYTIDGKKLVYEMPKELDHHVAEQLCLELDMLIESCGIREAMLDFSQTSFMDSSGIGVIIGRSKTMQRFGGTLCVKNLSKRVRMIFDAAGLGKIVKITEEM